MLRETQVDALMIARAAIGNPWIFNDIRTVLMENVELQPFKPTGLRPRRDLAEINRALEEHLKTELDFLNQLKEKYGAPPDDAAVDENLAATFRCHLFRYLHGLKGSSYIRGRLHELQTLPAIREAIKSCLEREAAYRASAPTVNLDSVVQLTTKNTKSTKKP